MVVIVSVIYASMNRFVTSLFYSCIGGVSARNSCGFVSPFWCSCSVFRISPLVSLRHRGPVVVDLVLVFFERWLAWVRSIRQILAASGVPGDFVLEAVGPYLGDVNVLVVAATTSASDASVAESIRWETTSDGGVVVLSRCEQGFFGSPAAMVQASRVGSKGIRTKGNRTKDYQDEKHCRKRHC